MSGSVRGLRNSQPRRAEIDRGGDSGCAVGLLGVEKVTGGRNRTGERLAQYRALSLLVFLFA